MKPVRNHHSSVLVRLLILASAALPLLTLQSTEYRPINRITLAEAINASNANPGDDQIIFDRNIDLSSTLPDINKASGSIVFHGTGHILSRSSQSGTDFRILTIRAGTVHIDSLTIRDGVAPDENGNRLGGGIYNLGTLTMSNSTVTANSATHGGGGLFSNGSAPSINNCTFSNNSSGEKGGGIFSSGTMLLNGSTITGNVSGNDGGGIRNGGNLVVSGCTISNNVSESNGGGLWNLGDLQVNTSTFTENLAEQGSGVYNEGINATLTDSHISGNSTLHYADYGGGICNELGNMTITNCTVASNNAIAGGGISVKGGTLDITGCTITNNLAWGDGGGLWVEDKLTELNGSPYLVEGNLNVTHSTIADNSADKGGGIYI
ncbi:MAG: right-handed parallel beta-helix repeat-containing protein, partial [Opitutales bacterium]|nr:right-handed parallel beta-helix repeat-containing protein [Opitutales bacterium]